MLNDCKIVSHIFTIIGLIAWSTLKFISNTRSKIVENPILEMKVFAQSGLIFKHYLQFTTIKNVHHYVCKNIEPRHNFTQLHLMNQGTTSFKFTTAQLHSTKPELRFCAGSNPACSVSEIRDGEDLWQWSWLEIRLNAFCRSTIPQKQCISIIIIIIIIIIRTRTRGFFSIVRVVSFTTSMLFLAF